MSKVVSRQKLSEVSKVKKKEENAVDWEKRCIELQNQVIMLQGKLEKMNSMIHQIKKTMKSILTFSLSTTSSDSMMEKQNDTTDLQAVLPETNMISSSKQRETLDDSSSFRETNELENTYLYNGSLKKNTSMETKLKKRSGGNTNIEKIVGGARSIIGLCQKYANKEGIFTVYEFEKELGKLFSGIGCDVFDVRGDVIQTEVIDLLKILVRNGYMSETKIIYRYSL
ncbi:hypothetical protein ECANGB1_87 [Enterospora canceri]|uniref:Uncharacterized protein n=1 Tax=Enterospora canceri TaxID=1081671 RepID=A0A1Y1S4M4_9MICR|nr:hypothetical protein ECANGB1_87 [Enterospora canceri]